MATTHFNPPSQAIFQQNKSQWGNKRGWNRPQTLTPRDHAWSTRSCLRTVCREPASPNALKICCRHLSRDYFVSDNGKRAIFRVPHVTGNEKRKFEKVADTSSDLVSEEECEKPYANILHLDPLLSHFDKIKQNTILSSSPWNKLYISVSLSWRKLFTIFCGGMPQWSNMAIISWICATIRLWFIAQQWN